MRRRPCPFIFVQTAHEEGNCWAQVVHPRGHFTGQTTITTYGANEEEAYQKVAMSALVNLSSTEKAGPTILRFLPTDEMDDEWIRRHERLESKTDTRPYAACMQFARDAQRMFIRAEDHSRFYYDRSMEARARVEDLEGQLAARVAQDEQRQTTLA